MADKVTVRFQGGPMDGESREFPKEKIPRVIETMEGINSKAVADKKAGRYELFYLYLGERQSEEHFREQAG